MASIQHIGITCSDLTRSEKFYTEKFGMKKVREIEVGAETMKAIFGIDSPAKIVTMDAEHGQAVELFEFRKKEVLTPNAATQIGLTHLQVIIADLEGSFNKFIAEGIPTIRVNRPQGGYIYFIKDPDGVLIELKGPAAPQK